ncbi:SCL-interrupting locus protein-like isoform X2 [Biomphalaria glabrata]|uniref:SCL-interrupting locus protein-like isoform X2 n=1 Tax=Biomphalaria glabrata TaxID=6526 RepID=A0A9W3ACU8_BIOGL|nr:SCL-interrupting locus protein-like isoform X2 [Biomphalaria glabrata]
MISEAMSASEIKNVNSFPKTKHSLWDKTVVGQTTFLHIAHYRKPRVCIPEKILRLIQHQCEHFDQVTHQLIGSLVVEADGEGVRIHIDRLDTRTSVLKENCVPGELLIPLKVANNAVKDTQATVTEYINAFQTLQERCCSKSSIELSNFLTCEGFATFYSNTQTSVVHLDLDMISVETVFKVTPIPAIPIVLTALSKNLAGPRSLSKVQGVPKTGYLTMDHTRKLLLVLESDPKASSLPLVGIWISGVEFVQHPFVWASCLRYIHNAFLQDRINLPPEDFLLVFYTTLHSKPEFYQCNTVSGTRDLSFKLYSGHEVTHITKAFSRPCDSMTEVEMGSTHSQSKQEIFDMARTRHKQQMVTGNTFKAISEDIEPRSAPIPHMEKVPIFQPVVPDVSVLWTDSPVASPQRSTMNNTPSYSVFPHTSPVARPTVQQLQRCPQIPLAQQYSPAYHMGFIHPAFSPSSHTAETSTINSHVSVSSQGKKPYPVSQDNPTVLPSLAGYPSPQYMLSNSDQYGPVSAYTSNRYPLEITGRHELDPAPTAGPFSGASNSIQYFGRADKVMPSLPDQVAVSQNVNRTRFVPPCALKTVVEESVSNPTDVSSQDRMLGLSSDGSASEDSGLSTTPDKNSSQQKQAAGSTAAGETQVSDKLSWEQLPADIRSLLIQQNEQIKLLQQQIQILLQQQAKQNISTQQACSHHDTLHSDGGMSHADQTSLPLLTQNKQMSPQGSLSQGHAVVNVTQTNQVISNTTPQSIQDVEKTLLQNYSSPAQHSSQSRESMSSTTLQSREPMSSTGLQSREPMSSTALQSREPMSSTGLQSREPMSSTALQSREPMSSTGLQSREPMSSTALQSREPMSSTGLQSREPMSLDVLKNREHLSSTALQSRELLSSTALQNSNLSDKTKQVVEVSSKQTLPFPESNMKPQQELNSSVKATFTSSRQIVNSPVSEIVNDSSYFDRSQLDQSPISVSQYSCIDQDESNSTFAEDATDPKQYYDQLMNNIQMFLSNTPKSEPNSEAETCLEKTVEIPTTVANSSLAQQLSYVSMLLGCGGDVGQSMEINAMAMKYLNDEQLTQMARLWKDTGYSTSQSNKVLQKVFSGALSAQDMSMWGSSPNMTMGTQMYLARHGLLGNDSIMLTSSNTDQVSMLEKFQLKTDFSTVTIGSQDMGRKLSCEVSGFETNKRIRDPLTPIRTPQEIASAQRYAHSPTSNINCLPFNLKPGGLNPDNGASPYLGGKDYREPNLRNVPQEGRRQDSSRKKLPMASTLSDDENLLDIAKLKQLPKLL